ncbi:MAG TPA: hypothetical protein PKM36_03010 [Propionibacteriaceae bacterium]|nr:hypothetical protein [Propionibacteriaceae bacterium]HPZ50143.1 hypothetical protein [Propionibacteriaceae bacterium]HQE32458.1 hypothetical protein [Propionibacteriaceae bacterium]
MTNEWGHGDDDEMARLLKGALRSEADRVDVPDRFAEVRTAAQGSEPRRTPWLYAVAAALVLVLGGGLIWQTGLFRGAESTTMAAPAPASAQDQGERAQVSRAPAQASAPAGGATQVAGGAGATPGPGTSVPQATSRTVTGPTIAFAAPSGNIVCLMSRGEVACQVLSATAWEQAAPRPCPVIGGGTMPFQYDKGGVSLTANGATLYCGGQALVAVDLAQKNPATSWYQAGRDTTVTTPYGTAPVLPYGGTATTTSGQKCSMAESGVLCQDPSGSAFALAKESLTLAGPTAATRTVSRYITVTQSAAFVTPSGGIVCAVDPSSATCEVKQPTYTPPAKPASCQLEWAGRIAVTSTERGFVCVGDSMFDLPTTGSAPWTTWFDPAFGITVPLPSGGQGAVLGYGSTITSGSYTCQVETTGVTCTDKAGRGFVVTKESYRYLP